MAPMKDQYSGHVNGLQSSIQIMQCSVIFTCNYAKKRTSLTLIFECRMASSHYLIGLKFTNCICIHKFNNYLVSFNAHAELTTENTCASWLPELYLLPEVHYYMY